ncbi:hypothetical protein C8J56DRAFT_1175044 [Mycena floridula]|nr:hypothetical protein C8J56DRAFT_1175044 [Mycena floridula]
MSHNPSPGPSLSLTTKPPKVKLGITAGAEDVKYQAKYKELKKKVKEIEGDNDRLHFKVLQTKRNIQRMKLERAILYERLMTVPSSQTSLNGKYRLEYYRANHRVSSGPDNRAAPVVEAPVGPGVGPNLPPMQSRRSSGGIVSAMDAPSRHGHLSSVQALEAPRPHSSSHSPSHNSPSMREHRSSQSSSRSRTHQAPPPFHSGSQQFRESLPPVQTGFHHSPAVSDRERPRGRHDISDVTHSPLSPVSHSSGRVHNHQRIGPGAYINREDERERELDHRDREREREREWERERERQIRNRDAIPLHSPQFHHRPRQEFQEHRLRDEPGYYHDVPGAGPGNSGHARLSRSGTPGSGSGSGSAMVDGPSRPDSRGAYYDHERSFRLRPVNHEEEFEERRGGASGFTQPPSDTRSTMDSRKRHRSEMDIDDANGEHYEDRGTKRYHRHEDERMGGP